MPFISTAIGLGLAAAGTVGGLVNSHKQAGIQQKGEQDQNAIAQQEMGDKQSVFDKLQSFLTPYLGSGSPFLSMIQRASAEQNAQQGNNAAGQVRSTMQTSGLGYGPSGATAAAEGGLAAEQAKTSSTDYLTNLLNNENVKFQAASQLKDAGAMAGSPQNQPNVSTNMPAASFPSAVGAAGSSLSGIINKAAQSSSGSAPGTLPLGDPSQVASATQIGLPGVPNGSAPVTTGWD